jgi:hypothetical protein
LGSRFPIESELGWFDASARHERGPGFSRLGIKLGGLAWHRRDPDKDVALGALNFPAGKLLVTLKVLLAMRAGKFEFVHNSLAG